MSYEIKIDGSNYRYSIRARRQYRPTLILLAVFLIVLTFFSGFSSLLPYLVFILVIMVAIQVFVPRTVLYRVVFDEESKRVKVEMLELNKATARHTIPYGKVKMVLQQNFWRRGTPWVLKIYSGNKLICEQPQTYGWPIAKLREIVKAARVLPA